MQGKGVYLQARKSTLTEEPNHLAPFFFFFSFFSWHVDLGLLSLQNWEKEIPIV